MQKEEGFETQENSGIIPLPRTSSNWLSLVKKDCPKEQKHFAC